MKGKTRLIKNRQRKEAETFNRKNNDFNQLKLLGNKCDELLEGRANSYARA